MGGGGYGFGGWNARDRPAAAARGLSSRQLRVDHAGAGEVEAGRCGGGVSPHPEDTGRRNEVGFFWLGVRWMLWSTIHLDAEK